MQIRISEVWNYRGESKELAIIEANDRTPANDVFKWILANRPDLSCANTPNDHGFHAIAI